MLLSGGNEVAKKTASVPLATKRFQRVGVLIGDTLYAD